MRILDEIDRAHERSYAERGMIAREFEVRNLWQYLIDPRTRSPFRSYNAWMGSGYIGCRSVNYEARRDMEELKDLPPSKLREVPKKNIKVLLQLSTAVRRSDKVLYDARSMQPQDFIQRVEKDFPDQHIESTQVVRFTLTRSAAKEVERVIDLAIERGARDRNEALEWLAATYSLEFDRDKVSA
jgi:hypothetical protein